MHGSAQVGVVCRRGRNPTLRTYFGRECLDLRVFRDGGSDGQVGPGRRLADELWERMEPRLPERPAHPLGCHNPRVPDRSAMDAIFFVLRTGSQWQALRASGICSPSLAYRRFREWAEAGVFEEFWRQGLLAYDELVGIDWSWMAVDGAMTKAPLGGEKSESVRISV